MPRPKKTDPSEQRGLPFEVMPEDMPPVDQTRKKGRKKKEIPQETDIHPVEDAKTEPEPFPAQDGFMPVKEILFSAPIPIAVRPKFEEIGEIIRTVCEEGIDVEYYHLGLLLLEKLARKRPSPILSGKAPAWAAGILFALGKINFLFDKSSQPFISQDDLADLCGLKKATAAGKGKQIRDLFQMGYWDSRFSTRRMQRRNPLANLVFKKNGLIVDFSSLLFR